MLNENEYKCWNHIIMINNCKHKGCRELKFSAPTIPCNNTIRVELLFIIMVWYGQTNPNVLMHSAISLQWLFEHKYHCNNIIRVELLFIIMLWYRQTNPNYKCANALSHITGYLPETTKHRHELASHTFISQRIKTRSGYKMDTGQLSK